MAFALRRITSSGRFVPEIDGLRFVAIASVVLYHLSGFVPIAGASHGYRGVNLFYVISGFILALPFAAQSDVSLRAYFLRRLTRLEPPYILNLLICTALLVLVSGERLRDLLPHLSASVFYLHNLWFGRQSTINPVAWTLEVEVQFYCLMPLLAAIFRVPSRRIVLALAILAAGALQLRFWNADDHFRLSILFAIQYFLAGLLMADIYLAGWKQKPTPHWLWDVVSLAAWPLIFLPPDRTVWLFLPFLMMAAFAGAFRGHLFRLFFRAPAVTAIGGMCYTIYLFHYQLIPPVVRIAGRLALLAYLPVLLIVSVAYFLLIERPCMKKDWPRRLAASVLHQG